tara:strand:- start:127 stop:273 length:147 start_codon:yes stop_codon:yes gene_type:complete
MAVIEAIKETSSPFSEGGQMSGLGPGCVNTQANTTDRREVGKFYNIDV